MPREPHHKKAGSYLQATSSRPLAELLELCKRVAEKVEPDGMYKWSPVRIEFRGSNANAIKFGVPSKQKYSLVFRVNGSQEDGQATIRSEITAFKTRQNTFLGIPMGPKDLVSYNWYENFMLDLEDAVLALDPEAEVFIEEQPA